MKVHNNIFNRKLLKRQLEKLDLNHLSHYDTAKKVIKNWSYSIEKSDLDKTKEESVQGDFLTAFFTDILGYKKRYGNKVWSISQEQKTEMDGTKADGALGFFTSDINDVRVVIELKDARTDLDKKQNRANKLSPVEQGFSYASKTGKKSNWVIVSNFKEIRLYHSSTQTEYEKFLITDLENEDEFKRFYFLLCFENLLNRDNESIIESLYRKNEEEQTKISKLFYSDYKHARIMLFEHLKENNNNKGDLLLFEKSQKLMDRFIFVCFCEDSGLLPEKIFRNVLRTARSSFDLSNTKIWTQLKGLFHSIDKGNQNHNINKFNGGLFKVDNDLDDLIITDEIFNELEKIAEYDFDSDLNVNILGHIFEQSISDIEEIKSEINGEEIDRNKGKRKKDGIFYTPEYITKYIVEEAIGGWLQERKKELGREEDLPKIPEKSGISTPQQRSARTKAINQNVEYWQKYRDILSNIKVLDPACGSGAFLNQAFDFLYKEGQWVNEKIDEITGGQIDYFDLDKHILKHNLYGVDLNKESVEITKLSLWLKTANKNDELTALDENIKCGNSLIDDKNVVGDSTFSWNDEYKDIMSSGGFDIVIGNPPYVRQENIPFNHKEYYKSKYDAYKGTADLYVYFIEKGIRLLAESGKYSVIVSNKFAKSDYGENLKEFIIKHTELNQFIDFGDLPVFEDAITYPCILLLSKYKKHKDANAVYCKMNTLEFGDMNNYISENKTEYPLTSLSKKSWGFEKSNISQVLNKIESQSKDLNSIIGGKYYRGILTGFNKAFIISETKKKELIAKDPRSEEIIKPFVSGKNIKPYSLNWEDSYLIFTRRGINIEEYPAVLNHLNQFKEELTPKTSKDQEVGRKPGKYKWFEIQDTVAYYNEFEKPKIIYPETSKTNAFYFDEENYYINKTAFIIPNPTHYLLCVLNSKIVSLWFKSNLPQVRGGYYSLQSTYLGQVPIKEINNDDEKIFNTLGKEIINKQKQIQGVAASGLKILREEYGIEKASNNILKFFNISYKQLIKEFSKQKIKLSLGEKEDLLKWHEKKVNDVQILKQNVEDLKSQIDQEIYKIYGLSQDEIKTVENNIK